MRNLLIKTIPKGRTGHSSNATLVAGSFTISHTKLRKEGPFQFFCMDGRRYFLISVHLCHTLQNHYFSSKKQHFRTVEIQTKNFFKKIGTYGDWLTVDNFHNLGSENKLTFQH
jgi:hypothetical protein